MSSFIIKYQTSDLVPPPFAYAIQITGKTEKTRQLAYEFEMTYVGREDMSEEDILEEGFSADDDFTVSGSLPEVWTDYWHELLKNTEPLYIDEISETQDFWQIESGDRPFYPSKPDRWKTFTEEFQQAVFEEQEWEAPLLIKILKLQEDSNEKLTIKGSFLNRKLETEWEANGQKRHRIRKWSELNTILGKVYGGEYLPDKADKKAPSKAGIYVNMGEEVWYEVGKSLKIQARKLLSLFTD